MKKTKNTLALSFLCFCLFLLPGPAFIADSTSFAVPEVKASIGGGVPVGTVVTWPSASNPEDMESWLECNGQSFSQATYPELYAVVGGSVPDYRGLFLRGHGSVSFDSGGYGNVAHASGILGQIQGDAVRNVTGNFDNAVYYKNNRAYGVFSDGGHSGGIEMTLTEAGYNSAWVNFSLSNMVPTSNENRPVNIAVRYLMRARP